MKTLNEIKDWKEMINEVINSDCIQAMKLLPDNCIDSIVTDPPYELGFMGKSWDNTGIANSVELWEECLRVLKPGGHLLAFSGTRTYHRMAVAIEDAGFEVRDIIEWVYGSGFPKSLNIGKSIEGKIKTGSCAKNNFHKLEGERRNGRIGMYDTVEEQGFRKNNPDQLGAFDLHPTTKEAKQWEGWGTALKPAHEPICMARKPLAEKTVAENCLKYGTGGINIDESRIEYYGKTDPRTFGGSWKTDKCAKNVYEGGYEGSNQKVSHQGRFPANLIHDNSEEVRECFPETGKSKKRIVKDDEILNKENTVFETSGYKERFEGGVDDNGGNASRFFKSIIYQAKSSKSDRNKGLDCYLTVKYNGSIINNNKTLCKEENMVAVQLLQKVISEQELVSFNIDESGVNIMVQCHKDSLSIILTEINRIIGLKIYNSLMHSLTNESTQVVNSEMEVGGSLAENVADLKRWILTITKGNQELALGASRVVCEMLQLISVEENWKEKTNTHATVKPIALMEYLIKMVTPKGGIVLDPFAGSGSTLIAAKKNGFEYIGTDMTEEYCVITDARLVSEKGEIQELLF